MLPLDGVEILDVGTLTPGKYCTFLLADLGAAVIRIERPADTRQQSTEDIVLNRNKRSLVLDLRSAEGLAALHRLAERADVLLEAQRPGVAARLGFGYDELRVLNEKLVYCSISGFGQTGTYKDRPAYDLMFMGMSGVWRAMLGGHEPPAIPGLYLADAVTGLVAAFAIVTGLFKRERGGSGSYIDLSMLESTATLLTPSHGLLRQSTQSGENESSGTPAAPAPSPASADLAAPGYRLYRAQDGNYIVLGAIRPAAWTALCALVRRPDLSGNPYPAGEQAHAMVTTLSETFATGTAQEWIERLTALGIDCSAFQQPADAHSHTALLERGMVATSTHETLGSISRLGSPLAVSFGRPAEKESPVIGAHTAEILAEIGVQAGVTEAFALPR
jgi:crotonobetainyl-CoA:carnitine CoA-transferase CaiB-like acyl-CoA transferase